MSRRKTTTAEIIEITPLTLRVGDILSPLHDKDHGGLIVAAIDKRKCGLHVSFVNNRTVCFNDIEAPMYVLGAAMVENAAP